MRTLDSFTSKDILVKIIQFDVPLNHLNPLETITVCVKVVNLIGKVSDKSILYLKGGPGYASPFPVSSSEPGFLAPLLERGYTVYMLDQRGTGLSSIIDVDLIVSKGSVEEQFEFIKNFRADSIVRDCEIIRKKLGIEKWYLLGQSYGGFTSTCYASLFPNSLKTVFLTGGLPPLGITSVNEVYEKTFERTKERQEAYYRKFPQDKEYVEFIRNHQEINPSQFNRLGMLFGESGGSHSLHKLVLSMYMELVSMNRLSTKTKREYEASFAFEANVIYLLFMEAIYLNGPGMKSDWTASKLVTTGFTDEIGDETMYDIYPNLLPLKPLMEYIHKYDEWSIIWDLKTLKSITWETLPIVALVYLDDQYVHYEFCRRNLTLFEHKQIVTNQLFHDGLRKEGVWVIDQLHTVLEQGDYI